MKGHYFFRLLALGLLLLCLAACSSDNDGTQWRIYNDSTMDWYDTEVWFTESNGDVSVNTVYAGQVKAGDHITVDRRGRSFFIMAFDKDGDVLVTGNITITGYDIRLSGREFL